MPSFLSERLPLWAVANDFIISKMGDTTIGFILSMPVIFDLSVEQILELHQAWVRAIQALLPNTILHKQDWYWQTKQITPGQRVPGATLYECEEHDFTGYIEEDGAQFLAGASDRHFHGRVGMEHICYLFISRRPSRRGLKAIRAMLQKNLIPQDTMSPEARAVFTASVDQFKRILEESGFNLTRLTDADLCGTADQPGIIERYCQLSMPGERPFLQDIELQPGLRIGNKHCQIHSVSDPEGLPAQCSPLYNYTPYANEGTPFMIGYASQLGILLPCNHIYNQYIVIEEDLPLRKQLERRGKHMQALAPYSRENALSKAANDAFLNDAVDNMRSIVSAHFNVMSWTEDPAGIGDLASMVGAAFARMGITPHLETIGAPQLWCAGIPGNAGDLPGYETFYTLAEQAACFLINDTGYQASFDRSGMRLADRLYGCPIPVDLSDGPMREGLVGNRNKAVFGPT